MYWQIVQFRFVNFIDRNREIFPFHVQFRDYLIFGFLFLRSENSMRSLTPKPTRVWVWVYTAVLDLESRYFVYRVENDSFDIRIRFIVGRWYFSIENPFKVTMEFSKVIFIYYSFFFFPCIIILLKKINLNGSFHTHQMCTLHCTLTVCVCVCTCIWRCVWIKNKDAMHDKHFKKSTAHKSFICVLINIIGTLNEILRFGDVAFFTVRSFVRWFAGINKSLSHISAIDYASRALFSSFQFRYLVI